MSVGMSGGNEDTGVSQEAVVCCYWETPFLFSGKWPEGDRNDMEKALVRLNIQKEKGENLILKRVKGCI